MVSVRLRASPFGRSRHSALIIEDDEVRLVMPNVLAEDWVIPRQQIGWLYEAEVRPSDPPEAAPAVFPRMLTLITNRSFRPNTTLVFTKPQRVPPRKPGSGVGPMPFSVDESRQGVWADGALVTVDHKGKAREALVQGEITSYPSLPRAVAGIYGTAANPRLDRTEMQDPLGGTQEGEGLIGPGPFWGRPEPVASSLQV
jgi:hypothetical protein